MNLPQKLSELDTEHYQINRTIGELKFKLATEQLDEFEEENMNSLIWSYESIARLIQEKAKYLAENEREKLEITVDRFKNMQTAVIDHD